MGDAILAAFHRLPEVQWMVTTLGSKGSVLLERVDLAEGSSAEPAVLEDLLEGTFAELSRAGSAHSAAAAQRNGGGQPACVSGTGVEIWEGGVAQPKQAYRLRLKRGGPLGGGGEDAERRRLAAAQVAAAANADAGNAAGYSGRGVATQIEAGAEEVVARVWVAQAARLPEVGGGLQGCAAKSCMVPLSPCSGALCSPGPYRTLHRLATCRKQVQARSRATHSSPTNPCTGSGPSRRARCKTPLVQGTPSLALCFTAPPRGRPWGTPCSWRRWWRPATALRWAPAQACPGRSSCALNCSELLRSDRGTALLLAAAVPSRACALVASEGRLNDARLRC